MQKVELSFAVVTFKAPVIYFEYKEGAELGLAEMKEVIALAEKLSWNRPYFTFSDVRVNMKVSPEARRYLTELNHLPFFRGAAALVKSSTMSYAINFLTVFQKKKYPFKAFTKKQVALKWLNSLPLENEGEKRWSLS